MAKDPTYPMYAQDFDMDTSFWTVEEVGTYIRLLNACWANNGLPTDHLKLARIVRMDSESFLKIWNETIKEKFFEKEGKFLNKKQEEVREFRYQKKQNGTKGGRPKKEKENQDKNLNETKTKPKPKPKQKPSNEIEVEFEKEVEVKVEKEVSKGEIPYQKIVDIFNSVCKDLPQVQKLTDMRKSVIKARINEYNLSDVGDVFQKVAQSSFLNGDNDRGWTAGFDWIMNPNNFIKILEGKYNGKSKSNNQKRYQPSDDLKQRIAEKMGA